ncbi:histone deacetylase [Photobacterium sp. 1_MG-2023]|uniref:histone deacetylase family protein n=1 Tax=Photobacterium sp. 1_MG-2023 TaxID=3062646 RepID=UPI0026E17C56|nr:histone deacetylase [Photobacterium sp. 1_MG-2023]MDO6705060.1 histone deacetylase [Photobacterium sp. 1_MG-2023]
MLPLVYHPVYSELVLPPQHRYPITKYERLYLHLTQTLQMADWADIAFFQPEPVTPEELKALHQETYIDHLLQNTLPAAKMRRIGFPWSPQLIERTLTSTAGTRLTVDLAYQHGISLHLSGGYHHAHHDFGSGFCLVNDLAFAARHALTLPGIDRVLIVDCDVHQGDGTATLLAEDSNIITFSVHCDKNFPARKPDSDIDLALPRETNTEDYLAAFSAVLNLALAQHQPDLVIYDAGVDIHQHDALGYFQVTTEGIFERDQLVIRQCKAAEIPLAAVVGGGYRDDHQQLVEIHAQLFLAALSVHQPERRPGQRIAAHDTQEKA